jgi:hypothetical protein
MIRAVKTSESGSARSVEEYEALKEYWHVTPHLEQLLGVELHRGTHTLFPLREAANAIDDRPYSAELVRDSAGRRRSCRLRRRERSDTEG